MRLKIELEIKNKLEMPDNIFREWVKMKLGYKSYNLSARQIEKHCVLLGFGDLDEVGGIIKKRITEI